MATFNLHTFFASKGKSMTTNVVIPTAEGVNYKCKLAGLSNGTATGLAKLAAAQVEEVRLSRDKTVTDGGIKSAPRADFTPKQMSEIITKQEEALLGKAPAADQAAA